jgi:hypothetical protein
MLSVVNIHTEGLSTLATVDSLPLPLPLPLGRHCYRWVVSNTVASVTLPQNQMKSPNPVLRESKRSYGNASQSTGMVMILWEGTIYVPFQDAS